MEKTEKEFKKLEHNIQLLQVFDIISGQVSTNRVFFFSVRGLRELDMFCNTYSIYNVLLGFQAQVQEMDIVEQDRNNLIEKMKFIEGQRDDLLRKGQVVETERNEFLRNNKLMEMQRDELDSRCSVLQKTNTTLNSRVRTCLC